jgi:hypothetical protein
MEVLVNDVTQLSQVPGEVEQILKILEVDPSAVCGGRKEREEEREEEREGTDRGRKGGKGKTDQIRMEKWK